MNDYISRESAFNTILKLVPKVDNDGYCWVIRGDAAAAIDSIPAADVRPAVRGKWKFISFMTVQCSNCREIFHELEGDNFCPNCGAMMEES